uniref:Uncharacterized protein n=1 Tax=Parascaris univalens TaxID=6257 RepID=A0A915A850_PARUN
QIGDDFEISRKMSENSTYSNYLLFCRSFCSYVNSSKMVKNNAQSISLWIKTQKIMDRCMCMYWRNPPIL